MAAGLGRYVATAETAKHRVFQFLDAEVLPDNMLVNIASADAYVLGVLSSRVHVAWALAAGARLGVGNDPRYTKTRCLDTFPFPAATGADAPRIRALGEALDAHRKRRQAACPALTVTGMYNELARVRQGEAPAEGDVRDLRELHDTLDAAVLDAYGWARDVDDAGIVAALCDLNAARAEEEARGQVRWLRPEIQAPRR
jgi:hypothetical protein